jgi:predicted nucleic acid-binding protein
MRGVMNELATDASALLYALTEPTDRAAALRARLARTHCHAPHLVDAEVGQALRRKARRGELDPDTAHATLHVIRSTVDTRYPLSGALAELAWAMRDNLSYYDGLYVGVAAALRVPLLTADARLAAAPNLPCEVELVA